MRESAKHRRAFLSCATSGSARIKAHRSLAMSEPPILPGTGSDSFGCFLFSSCAEITLKTCWGPSQVVQLHQFPWQQMTTDFLFRQSSLLRQFIYSKSLTLGDCTINQWRSQVAQLHLLTTNFQFHFYDWSHQTHTMHESTDSLHMLIFRYDTTPRAWGGKLGFLVC